VEGFDEDTFFDIVELFHDTISKPVKGHYHDYYDCGWHYYTFDATKGQEEYRKAINEILADYENESAQNNYRVEMDKQLKDYNEGFELDKNGHIIRIPSQGFKQLLDRKLPTENDDIISRVNQAIYTYHNRKSSRLERKEAVRHLADILEGLRKKVGPLIKKKDESDLFILINRFGIRHNDPQQKDDYDDIIFLSWMFHYFLATIHAWLLVIKRNNGNDN
jgi:hypothetical protein